MLDYPQLFHRLIHQLFPVTKTIEGRKLNPAENKVIPFSTTPTTTTTIFLKSSSIFRGVDD